jgi:hypothetical protein
MVAQASTPTPAPAAPCPSGGQQPASFDIATAAAEMPRRQCAAADTGFVGIAAANRSA